MELSGQKVLTHRIFISRVESIDSVFHLQELVRDLMRMQVNQRSVLDSVGKGTQAKPVKVEPLVLEMLAMITEVRYLRELAARTHLLYLETQQEASNMAVNMIVGAVPSFQNGEEWELVS